MEELTTAALAVVGGKTAIEAAKGFLEKIGGPAAEELGLMLQDTVRLYRLRNQLRVLTKAEQMLKRAGLEPSEVPLRALLPLLESAGLEDKEELSAKWAALLANAAGSKSTIDALPSFVAILNQLSPTEALLLDVLYQFQQNHRKSEVYPSEELIEGLQIPADNFYLITDNLFRLGLCEGTLKGEDGRHLRAPMHNDGILFTRLGWAFIKACYPPQEHLSE